MTEQDAQVSLADQNRIRKKYKDSSLFFVFGTRSTPLLFRQPFSLFKSCFKIEAVASKGKSLVLKMGIG